MLEVTANQDIPEIPTMDSAFVAAGKVAEKKFAAFVIARITRMAASFPKTTVQGTEAPIVVPD